MLVIFSDLDGTILDEHTYSFHNANIGLSALQNNFIPLILVSSKTFYEMIPIHESLGLSTPFIFENGGGIGFQSGSSMEYSLIGNDSRRISQSIVNAADCINKPIAYLHEMGIPEIIKLTGLDYQGASLSKKRMTSFPFIFKDDYVMNNDELQFINESLRSSNLRITRGQRFFHIHDLTINKGIAIEHLIYCINNNYSYDSFVTAGIGDSQQDFPMLEITNYSILVRKIPCDIPHIQYSMKAGPSGFTETILSLLSCTLAEENC